MSLRDGRSSGYRESVSFVRTYWVYLIASESGALYLGVTNHIATRVLQHKQGTGSGHTTRYRFTKLVWCEPHRDVRIAIAREKEIKGWRRSKKVHLIESENPTWRDLSPH